MNPIPDGAGDYYLRPSNMVPVGSEPLMNNGNQTAEQRWSAFERELATITGRNGHGPTHPDDGE